MLRTMRVEYPGAICHVMDRGDRREDIFVNDVGDDPGKLAMAARVRKETALSMKWIAARLQMGTSKSLKPMLYNWIHAQAQAANHTTGKSVAKSNALLYVIIGDPALRPLAKMNLATPRPGAP
jgi:hypothetical protein